MLSEKPTNIIQNWWWSGDRLYFPEGCNNIFHLACYLYDVTMILLPLTGGGYFSSPWAWVGLYDFLKEGYGRNDTLWPLKAGLESTFLSGDVHFNNPAPILGGSPGSSWRGPCWEESKHSAHTPSGAPRQKPVPTCQLCEPSWEWMNPPAPVWEPPWRPWRAETNHAQLCQIASS